MEYDERHRAIDPSGGPRHLSRAGPHPERGDEARLHRGVVVTGEDGEDGPKAFYIHIKAKPGKTEDIIGMLRDIFGFVLGEPATGPWFGICYLQTTFGIFEAFPDIAGRNAHVAGGGGDIFRDTARMNDILAGLAHICRVDLLFAKKVSAA